MQSKKSLLMRWCLWFFLGNVFLFYLIGLNYLPSIPWLNTPYLNSHFKLVLKFFSGFAYLGQFGLLALAPCLILLPMAFLLPNKKFIFILSILIATVIAMLLIVDSFVYRLYHFHLNSLIMTFIVGSLRMLDLSHREIIFAILIVVGTLLSEIIYGYWVWRRLEQKKLSMECLKYAAILLCFCLYTSYAMIFFSAGLFMNRIFLDSARSLPLYTEFFATFLPIKQGQIGLARMGEKFVIQPVHNFSRLDYPLRPLQYDLPKHPMNLVIIVIDTWRFDMLNKEVTPTLYEFAKKSWVFTNHFSGGNCTGPGIFTLFYGLPSNYWTAMESQQQGPVLIDELIKQHYQLGIFSSATLLAPAFHRTVFSAVHDLDVREQPGLTPDVRDAVVTQKFARFVEKVGGNAQPFFGFVFYDVAHGYCSADDNRVAQPFQPAVKICNRASLTNSSDPLPYLNRYKNALQLADKQVKEVLETLKTHHLLNNTVVIVTGDHGEEFNDNHLGYWSHASNFTHYQVQTPLIVYWPGAKPRTFAYKTTHFDIAPTLMHQLLGCISPASYYSVGKSLFDQALRPYIIVGSYVDFGVIEPNRITTVFPAGDFRVEQPNGQVYSTIKLDLPVIQHVFLDLKRFYKG